MPVWDKIDNDVTHEKVINHVLKKLRVGLGHQQLSMVGDDLIQEQLSHADYSITRPRKTQRADLS